MTSPQSWPQETRVAVTILVAGGEIAPLARAFAIDERSGSVRDAELLPGDVPSLAVEIVDPIVGDELDLPGLLQVARRARDLARGGQPVVVATATWHLEEAAALCDQLHDSSAPIVLTSSFKHAGAIGSDAAHNLHGAVWSSVDERLRGMGALVYMDGDLHAALEVRQVDSVGVNGFESLHKRRVARFDDGLIQLTGRSQRPTPIAPLDVDAEVAIVTPTIGTSPRWISTATAGLDGLVLALPGAGYLPTYLVDAIEEVCDRIPVVACPRPLRGAILSDYDAPGRVGIRSTNAICVERLSSVQTRIKLVACIGAKYSPGEMRDVFAEDDH